MNANILITGVSKGVGLTTTRILLEKGDVVYGLLRTMSVELQVLQKEYPSRLHLYKLDLAKTNQLKKEVFGTFLPSHLPLHGFVNNAAQVYDDLVTNLNFERLSQLFQVNVFAPFLLSKLVIRKMILHKTPGSIVHLSSISVHTGYKGLAMYAATKGAVEAFSKNLAREWGSRGIRSNCVVAGFMETAMTESLTAEQKKRIYARNCLKKPTEVRSVAETICFLLSNNSSITGQNIFVDSGTI